MFRTTLIIATLALSAGCATTEVSSSATDNAPADDRSTSTSSAEPTTTAPATSTSTTTSTTTTTTTVPIEVVRLAAPGPAAVGAPATPIEAVGTGNGDATAAAQQRLLDLGFWLAAPNGDYDLTTQQAVMAFQKYYGLSVDGVLGGNTAEQLNAVRERPAGEATTSGLLAEVDKSKQLLFVVDNGVTNWILNTSTGSEIPYDEVNKNTGEREVDDSITPTGVFDIYTQRKDGWWEGDLGRIYRPKYVDGGVAIHGSNSIPAYPASHGCIRVSVPAMDWIWDGEILPQDTTVWIHGAIPGATNT